MIDIQENKRLFNQNTIDNYNSWVKPWLDNIDEISEKNVRELITNEEEISNAKAAYETIIGSYNNIYNMYKNQHIKAKKVGNVFIIIFCCLIIGLFFLPFLLKNKKIIKNFEQYKIEQLNIVDEQNEIKKNSFINLFKHIKKIDLLNSYFQGTGLLVVNKNYGSNLEEFISRISDNFIGLNSFGTFKAGGQNVYVGNACNECWKNVTTSASISVPYIVSYRDSEGNYRSETRYETVTAYHYEPTPYRNIQTLTTIGFRKGYIEKEVNWMLNINEPDLKKEEKKVDHLKTKKIAKNTKQKIDNATTFENQMFNLGYTVDIFGADGSMQQEQDILSWFTIGTQDKFVEMRKDLTLKNKFYLINNPIYKIENALIIENNNFIDCSWYSLVDVLNSLDYNPRTNLEHNIKIIAKLAKNVAINNMISTCEFLNFSKINSLLNLNPIEHEYSILEPENLNIENNMIDKDTILSYANLTNSFCSNGQRALVDNTKTVYSSQNENFTIGVYEIDNYYTTSHYDSVTVYAPMASRYVTIEVPYTRFNAYKTQSTGIGFSKKMISNLNNFNEKIQNEFPQLVFNVFDNEEHIYLFANNTNFNEQTIEDIKLKISSMLN